MRHTKLVYEEMHLSPIKKKVETKWRKRSKKSKESKESKQIKGTSNKDKWKKNHSYDDMNFEEFYPYLKKMVNYKINDAVSRHRLKFFPHNVKDDFRQELILYAWKQDKKYYDKNKKGGMGRLNFADLCVMREASVMVLRYKKMVKNKMYFLANDKESYLMLNGGALSLDINLDTFIDEATSILKKQPTYLALFLFEYGYHEATTRKELAEILGVKMNTLSCYRRDMMKIIKPHFIDKLASM